jgi:hypothetical protein
MTFLNPLVLLGLAAAAIPVILHLLNRRRLRTVEFSSLRFLKELQQSSLRRLKFRQWLLLLLRTLLIVALVLSFARPVIQGSFAGIIGSRARNSMVFVIDDSPSMTVRTERGMVFDRAREAATRVLALAGEGDRIAILPLSALAPGTSPPGYEQPQTAKSILQRLEPSQVARRFIESLPIIRTAVRASHDANREVYIFTDGQASQFAATPPQADSAAALEKDVRCFLIRPNTSLSVNAGVTGARIETRFLARNRPARILVALQNFSDTPIRQETVSLYLDDARVAQQSVDLPPHGSAVVPVSFVPRRTGFLIGHATIDDDGLEADNSLQFVLMVPEAFTVLIAGPGTEDVRYPELALTLGGDSLTAGRIDTRRIPSEQLPLTDLSRTRVLLLNGINALSPAEGTATVNYVRRGGNVILLPGARLDASSFNDFFWKPLGLPGMDPALAPGPSGAPTGPRRESFLSFASVDKAHPLFAGLFDDLRKGHTIPMESPKIHRTAGLRPGGVPIITLSNGESFLAEYDIGSGRILAFGVDPGTAWSDFPLKGIFAPLLHRAVAYCSIASEEESTAAVGSPLRFAVRSGGTESSKVHVILSPSGLEERVAPRIRSGQGILEFLSSPTTETGVYVLQQGAPGSDAPVTLAARAVALPPWEGDLDTLRQEDLPAFWSALGIGEGRGKLLKAEGDLERAIQESRYGLELWRYFLVFAVLCALAEMFVGRERRTEEEPQ